MRKVFLFLLVLLWTTGSWAAEKKTIRISTQNTDLILQVGEKGRLYQTYFGKRLRHDIEANALSWEQSRGSDGGAAKRGWDVMSGSGNEDYFEPAIGITHADGNMSTYLKYVSDTKQTVEGGTETIITLRDDAYPVTIKLHYVAYNKENVLKSWTEISHQEKKNITMQQYASSMLYFAARLPRER